MKKSLSALATALFTVILSGCGNNVEYSGNQINFAEVEEIKPGQSIEQVVQRLGTPMHVSPFGEKKYFYIKSTFHTRPVFDPVVESIDIAEISFDDLDVVKKVAVYRDLKPEHLPQYSRRQHIEGSELNPIQQIVTNVGKYNTKKKAIGN